MANQATSNTNTAQSTLPSILMRLFLACELPYRYFVPGPFMVRKKMCKKNLHPLESRLTYVLQSCPLGILRYDDENKLYARSLDRC